MPTGNSSRPDDTNWTGAKIKSCYRLASLLDVPLVQASQNVAPVAVTAGDKIEVYASGLPEDVCRRIERACIRGRKG
jgi:hypothetical protein